MRHYGKKLEYLSAYVISMEKIKNIIYNNITLILVISVIFSCIMIGSYYDKVYLF